MKKLSKILLCFFVLCAFLTSPVFAADLINLNTATVEQLTSLPGIGPATADKIVEYRATKPFTSVEEIVEVKGIGEKKFEAIKDLITVGEAEPANE